MKRRDVLTAGSGILASSLLPKTVSAEGKTMTEDTFALTRPLHVGQSHLVVRDLDMTSSFYQHMLGLAVLDKSASGMVLGAGSAPLLTLTTHASAAQRFLVLPHLSVRETNGLRLTTRIPVLHLEVSFD